MEFEMAHSTCSLCKRQLPASSAGHLGVTRLCEKCQSMVLTAFRGAHRVVGAPVAAVDPTGSFAQVQPDAPAVGHPGVASDVFVHDSATVESSFEQETPHPIPFEAHDESAFELFGYEAPDYTIHASVAELQGASGNGSSLHRYEYSEGFVQSISVIQPIRDHGAEAANGNSTADLCVRPESMPSAESSLAEDHTEEQTTVFEAVADPWEAPLLASDYSQSEWPVLVGPSNRGSFTRLGASIAAVVLLVCASAYYFLIYCQSTPERRPATDSGTNARVLAVAEPRNTAEAKAPDGRNAISPTPSDARAREASQPQNIVSNENSNAQGRFSLQVAAFPTESGADEFAEKLKRAGVPSYVVPAQLVRRGRWFRVRVGRFNGADEAQRFAGEAQLRARAAGLAVQLIVCQYDQP